MFYTFVNISLIYEIQLKDFVKDKKSLQRKDQYSTSFCSTALIFWMISIYNKAIDSQVHVDYTCFRNKGSRAKIT